VISIDFYKEEENINNKSGLGDHHDATVRKHSYFSDSELKQYQDNLLAKRTQMKKEIATLQNKAVPDNRHLRDKAAVDIAEMDDEILTQLFTQGVIDGKRVIIREIDRALERIKNGTYGICMVTNRMISKTLLCSMPWAKYSYDE